MQLPQHGSKINGFQSTPDLVNRENVFSFDATPGALAFQSTPDLVNRENRLIRVLWLSGAMFQSTPDLVNRENVRVSSKPIALHAVSIHSRFS